MSPGLISWTNRNNCPALLGIAPGFFSGNTSATRALKASLSGLSALRSPIFAQPTAMRFFLRNSVSASPVRPAWIPQRTDSVSFILIRFSLEGFDCRTENYFFHEPSSCQVGLAQLDGAMPVIIGFGIHGPHAIDPIERCAA
jgi:hypothetical protein